MGFSITEEKARKLDELRREGRLCKAATRTRAGCSARANRKVMQQSWWYKIGEGTSSIYNMTMCKRHADQMPIGFKGVNFIVLQVSKF